MKRFIVVILSTLIYLSSFAQMSSRDIDRLVEDAMQKFKVVGTSISIVKDGKIIYSKGYGLKSIESKEQADKNTQYCIASNSKAFTTTALAMLVEDGKLSWEDKVVDYIPEFKMYNDYVTNNFNIQDLLTHRSGLGLGAGDLTIFPDGSDFTIIDIAKNFQYMKPQTPFRTHFDYDNLLYLIAGEVLQRVSGMSWENFIETRILKPLEMNHSVSGIDMLKDKKDLASPHATEKDEIKVIPQYAQMINGAAAGIYASSDDVAKWMLVHLNHGRYGDNLEQQLFSQDSQNELWRIHTVTETNRNPRYNSHFSGYGLGFDLSDIRGNMKVSHTGGMPGMLSKVIMIPDLDFGLVILTNTSEGGAFLFESVSSAIVDSYLGLDDFKWVDKYYAYSKTREEHADSVTIHVWETVKKVNQKKINKEKYIGIYQDPWFGKIEVFMKDKQLWFKSYRSLKLNGAMYYYQNDTFAIKWEYRDMNADALAIFTFDGKEKVQAIKMKGISPNIDFSFDFQDLDLKRMD